MNNKIFGDYGEKQAEKFLKKNGFKILDKNYRIKSAEIDIIAIEKNTLCFIEVKTRSSDEFGLPSEAVNIYKQRKIIMAANAYLMSFDGDFDVRFDIVEVYAKKGILGACKVNLIKNAFDNSN